MIVFKIVNISKEKTKKYKKKWDELGYGSGGGLSQHVQSYIPSLTPQKKMGEVKRTASTRQSVSQGFLIHGWAEEPWHSQADSLIEKTAGIWEGLKQTSEEMYSEEQSRRKENVACKGFLRSLDDLV